MNFNSTEFKTLAKKRLNATATDLKARAPQYPVEVFQRLVPPPLPITGDPLQQRKPAHRGRLHQIAFFLSVPAGLAMILRAANTNPERIVAAIYALSVSGLYFTSGLYNRLLGTPKLKPWMRWLDHSMIYVLIAGSYTPVTWMILKRQWSVPLLSVIWLAALGGIGIKMTSLRRFRRLGGGLYFAMGWAAIAVLPQLLGGLPKVGAIALALGGACYMLGSLILRMQRPNPTPDFGYHEVWHLFVCAAGVCHFVMNWVALTSR
jgi:hemolysin III